MPYFCYHCGVEVKFQDRVGRTETCLCGTDLHCCLNCVFYDTSAYNDCREPNAERVLEKGRSNFCDYFEFVLDRKSKLSSREKDAKSQLEALFKK